MASWSLTMKQTIILVFKRIIELHNAGSSGDADDILMKLLQEVPEQTAAEIIQKIENIKV